VPTVVSALLNVPANASQLKILKRFGCGAAPISVEVRRAFEAHTGVALMEGYGLTEATALTHCTPQDGEPAAGSIGPDAYAGELPVAYVALKPGASAAEEELRAFCADKVPERPAAPSEVIFLDQLPVTAVGKIFKLALRCDATRRAFDTALAPLRSLGVEIRVEATPDDRYGIVARVTVLGVDPAAWPTLTAEVNGILGRFAVHREVVIEP